MRRLTLLALASATLAGTAAAQTSVDIRTGPNGQLSGSATAGGTSSRVNTGTPDGARAGAVSGTWQGGQGARSESHCTGNGRTVTVTSPDGSSSSSVSTSGDGVASVGGTGSPGSRVRYGDCDGPTGRAYGSPTSPAYSGAGSAGYATTRGGGSYATASTSAGPARHRGPVRHHRKRRARRQ
jgi:hypothetical protein